MLKIRTIPQHMLNFLFGPLIPDVFRLIEIQSHLPGRPKIGRQTIEISHEVVGTYPPCHITQAPTTYSGFLLSEETINMRGGTSESAFKSLIHDTSCIFFFSFGTLNFLSFYFIFLFFYLSLSLSLSFSLSLSLSLSYPLFGFTLSHLVTNLFWKQDFSIIF